MKRIWITDRAYNKLQKRAKEEGKTVDQYIAGNIVDIFHALGISPS